LQAFRNSASLRIAVTVDMIATGTDVKPLECVFFLRDVRSASYFEQMKGRGARTIPAADFQAVTPDATAKTRFVLVDAVGVTEHDYVDAAPLERKRSVSLKSLLDKAAMLTLTEDDAATLASRLAKLELELTPTERAELDDVAHQPLRTIVAGLVQAVDPDVQAAAIHQAQETADDGAPRPGVVVADLIAHAAQPLAANPDLRVRILELRATHDQVIDEATADVLLDAFGVVDPERARSVVESWAAYLAEHRDEITALQVLSASKDGQRVSYADLRELADRIQRPPHNWTVDLVWNAYESLDTSRVHHSTKPAVTDLIALVRYTLGLDGELIPYAEQVRERYAAWLLQQANAGVTFTPEQRWWLDRIADVIATSAGITPNDLDATPFTDHGGIDGALRALGNQAGDYLAALNKELTA